MRESWVYRNTRTGGKTGLRPTSRAVVPWLGVPPRQHPEARRKQMAGVVTRQEATRPVAASRWEATSRKYAVEVIGTFFLVFTVAVSGLSGSAFTPLAAGAVL